MRKFLMVGLSAFAVAAALILFVLYPPIRATHPALASATLPDLVPLRAFYADHNAKWRYRLSPDGTRIAWLEAKRLKPALWVRDLDDENPEIYHTPDEVRWYTWSGNGQYLLYQADRDGWENDQIVSIDVTKPGSAPRTYDFGRDVKSWIQHVPAIQSSEVLVAHNGRDSARFDLYRLNLDTGDIEPLDEIADRSVSWSFTRDGRLFGQRRWIEGSNWVAEVKRADAWQEIARGGLEDSFYMLAEPGERGEVLAVSDLGRDKSALVRRNIDSKVESVIYEHPEVDISWVSMDPATDTPQLVTVHPGLQERVILDPTLEPILSQIPGLERAALHRVSFTQDFSKSIWEVEDDTRGWQKYLVDRENGTVEAFDPPQIAAVAHALSPTEPVFIPAADGHRIPAYLTRPKGVNDPGPMVVLIHGGPVARVYWGFSDLTSWLANRGYAVLNVNYRGGSGYGRAFREAAVGEVSRKMHQDIVDARAWAVAQGIADPDAVAVMGGSFGGLKTLTAMTESPDLFAAGVNINGVSDLPTMLQEVPVYWTGWPDWYRKYLGDPSDPDQLAEIKLRSPVYNVDRVKGPILTIQGANDVRVIRDQADRFVKAMDDAGKDQDYILIDGAGHTFSNMSWQQRLLMFRKIERFLARNLGGRADGFDYAVIGAQIIP